SHDAVPDSHPAARPVFGVPGPAVPRPRGRTAAPSCVAVPGSVRRRMGVTTVGYVWGAVAAALSLFGGPWSDAVAELSQSRASREEVVRSCRAVGGLAWGLDGRSEEHTSELQSRENL